MHIKMLKHLLSYRLSSLWIARLLLVMGMVGVLLFAVPGNVCVNSAAPDVATYINQHGGQTTPDQVAQDLLSGNLPSNVTYDQKISDVYLSTDYTGPLTAATMQDVPSQFHATATIEKES